MLRGRGHGLRRATSRASRARKSAYEMQFYAAECLYNSLPVREGGEELRRVRDTGAGRQVPEGRGLRLGARLAEAARADFKSRSKLPEVQAVLQSKRPAGGREAAAHRARARARGSSSPPPTPTCELLPNDEKAPGIAYKAAELLLRPQRVPRGAQALRGHRQDATRRTRSPSSPPTSSWRASSSTRTGGASRRSPARLAAEQGRHRPEERALQGPGQVQARRPVQARRRADGQGRVRRGGEEVHRSWSTRSRSTSSPTRRSTTPPSATRTPAASTRALKLYERIFREYPNSQAGRRGAVPRGGERGELVRLRQGGRELPAAGEGLPGLQGPRGRAVQRRPPAGGPAALRRGRRRLPALRRPLPQGGGRAEEPVPRRADLREAGRLPKDEIRALNEFVRQVRGKTRAGASWWWTPSKRIGDAYAEARATRRTPRKACEAAADEFDRRRLKPDAAPMAADAAAEARFQLAEHEFKEFDKLKIGGKGKALEQSFTAKRAAVKKVQRRLRRGLQVQAPGVDAGRALPPAATRWSASAPPSSRRRCPPT